jgi:small redox-active disulfide protein 2
MALFGFRKKKEEVKTGCDCGGTCETKTPVAEETGCCCGNCDSEILVSAETEKNEVTEVKVLGSGCAKCNQLEAAAKEALETLGMDTKIDHVTDFAQIAAYGVMSTPALVIDGKVVSYGKVLKTEEVIKILEKVRG